MTSLLIGANALVLLIVTTALITCKRIAKSAKSLREREAAGKSSRSLDSSTRMPEEDSIVESTQKEDLSPGDSLRLPMNMKKKAQMNVKKTRIESGSSTDVIVVPLGKAQNAVVTRNNMTKPERRKRDQSRTSRRDSQKKVKFREGNRKRMTGKTALVMKPASIDERSESREENASEKSWKI
ncbi:hypothetical protein RB195_013260 [Necator americanus]